MRDLLDEGLKLGESLAKLPWKAARRATGGRSETLDAAANLGERLGTLPFRAARKLLGAAGRAAEGGGGAGEGTGAKRVRILVLGAGYSGLTCFLELQEHLGRSFDLVMINSDKYHWFTAELHTYVAGEQEDAVRIPLARVVAPPGRLLLGQVQRIHPDLRQVELSGGDRLAYDYLIFGLGSDPEYFNLPGVAENSLILGNWQGAAKLRERVGQLVEQGRPEASPRVVVAGGGLTGVEVAAELADEYHGRVRLAIVEAGPEIMTGFEPDLVRVARGVMEQKGITVRTGNPIARVEPGRIHFKDGELLEADLLVWAGGVRGSGVLTSSGLATTPRGRGLVDQFLRAQGHAEIYIVGDAAAFMDPAAGREVPPSAQFAVQMGRAAGKNLLRRLQGQAEQPFVPRLRGAFASLGRTQGVGQVGQEQFTGLPAMVMKQLIEAHHAWESGGGVGPLVGRLLRAPRRFLGRPAHRGQRIRPRDLTPAGQEG